MNAPDQCYTMADLRKYEVKIPSENMEEFDTLEGLINDDEEVYTNLVIS